MTDDAMQDTMLWNFWHTFWTIRRRPRPHDPAGERADHQRLHSVGGKLGTPGLSNYAASKHAINGLVKTAAKEVGTLGITINAVCPGAIETDDKMRRTHRPRRNRWG